MSAEIESPEEWTDDKLEEQFPAIGLAYDLAVKSYDVAQERADKLDVKIHSIMALSAAITFGLTLSAKNLDLSLDSWWLVLILVLFGFDTFIFISGRFGVGQGNLIVIDPRELFRERLESGKTTFKKDQIFYAGEALKENSENLILPRWKRAKWLSISLALKVWVFLAWASTHLSKPHVPTPEKGVEEADYYLYLMTEQMIPYSLPF